MSRTDLNRNLYFNKCIKNTETVEDYLLALAMSPFKTHRRMAEALLPEYERMKAITKADEREQ